MIPEFEKLNNDEVDLMFKAPLLTAILVAGADDTVDRSELKEAVNIITLRPQKSRKELVDYYTLVAEDVEDKLKVLLHEFPSNTIKRTDMITDELKKLNSIFPKLDKNFSIRFYESLIEIALRIAESSGGVFGFMSVGYEESRVIDLKMIKDPSQL
ncbi:MAG TPA: hypothetical protein VGA21_00160 [Cyclobacteriaceae bacterium]|jgi:hypothetical protein